MFLERTWPQLDQESALKLLLEWALPVKSTKTLNLLLKMCEGSPGQELALQLIRAIIKCFSALDAMSTAQLKCLVQEKALWLTSFWKKDVDSLFLDLVSVFSDFEINLHKLADEGRLWPHFALQVNGAGDILLSEKVCVSLLDIALRKNKLKDQCKVDVFFAIGRHYIKKEAYVQGVKALMIGIASGGQNHDLYQKHQNVIALHLEKLEYAQRFEDAQLLLEQLETYCPAYRFHQEQVLWAQIAKARIHKPHVLMQILLRKHALLNNDPEVRAFIMPLCEMFMTSKSQAQQEQALMLAELYGMRTAAFWKVYVGFLQMETTFGVRTLTTLVSGNELCNGSIEDCRKSWSLAFKMIVENKISVDCQFLSILHFIVGLYLADPDVDARMVSTHTLLILLIRLLDQHAEMEREQEVLGC